MPRLPATAQTHDKSRFSLIADWSVVRVLLISLFAAVASLGMYTFLAPFVTAVQENAHVTMYLWFLGVSGVCGSILIGYVVDVFDLKKILFFILSLLFIAFLAVFVFSKIDLILIALPLIIWGAVGWALQVPQNNELLKLREQSGDGNLAVGLNQSSVYLGGSLGSILGGILVSLGVSPSSLPLYYMLPIIISILLLVVRRKS